MFVELLEKRSYNNKHLLKVMTDENGNPVLNEQGQMIPDLTPDGRLQMKMNAHCGHIHYLKDGSFEPLDWTLLWDDTRRGWFFNTHSYNPFLPEYSDGWAEFRDRFHDKDQTVRYKAIVQNIVKGEMIETDETNPNFDDNIDNKGVLYRNAFGENRDYLLYNTRSSLVKVATVNNPNECTADAVFEWELEFPDKEIFRVDKKKDAEEMTAKKTKTNTEDGKLAGYKLEKRDGKNLDTNKLTLIGNSKLDGKEWYTYLKSFKAWDSEGNTIEIVARISFVNGKAILKKTIPLEFLQKAVGKVFTDTTTSFYSGAPDGSTYISTENTWSNLVGGNGTSTVDAQLQAGRRDSVTPGKWAFIVRGRITFDTSNIPDAATISEASVYLYSTTSTVNQSLKYFAVNIYNASFGSNTTQQASDYQNSGTTPLSSDKPFSEMTTDGYMTWALNSTGISAVSKTGYTNFSVRDVNDVSNTDPVTSNKDRFDRLFCYTSEQTGTSQDPYLSVTYSPPPATCASLLLSLIS